MIFDRGNTSIPRETRNDRRAVFLRVLQKLRAEFPLEERIAGASPTVREAYAEVLLHWLHKGTPPGMDVVPELHLKALAAMDAVVLDERGIGCYPFSAHDTGIRVHYSGKSVYAMCAMDALAIPRLSRAASWVAAQCVVCRCHLTCAVGENGSLENRNPEGIRVALQARAQPGGPCCNSLCAGIRFVCKDCPIPSGATDLPLPVAAALGNAFFSFQRRLLDHYTSTCIR